MNNIYVRYLAMGFLYILLQVFAFDHLVLFNIASPFIYILFLLMLPINLRFSLGIIIAFFLGLTIDIFSVNAVRGAHAFAATLMMSLRGVWVNLFTNRFSYHGSEEYLLQVQSAPWYAQYIFPLIFVHQLAYHTLEAFGFGHFGLTLQKVGASSVYTFVICLIFILVFHKSNKR